MDIVGPARITAGVGNSCGPEPDTSRPEAMESGRIQGFDGESRGITFCFSKWQHGNGGGQASLIVKAEADLANEWFLGQLLGG